MDAMTIARLGKDMGVALVAVSALVYLAIFLVKSFVGAVTGKLSDLVTQLTIFMSKVKTEHENSKEDHKEMMKQHKEMIDCLGRINGYNKQT